jgi:hypothetical protein
MFNTLASYYATEELFFPEWEFKGATHHHQCLLLDRIY